jgi:hypothetical protein
VPRWPPPLAVAAVVPRAATAQNPPTRPVRPAPGDTIRRPVTAADSARMRADSLRLRADTGVVRTDTASTGPRRVRVAASRPVIRPPISPRRAFLYSLAVPGFGQAKLERPSAGALFVAIEATALIMARKSLGDLREAKRFERDSLVPELFPVDSADAPVRPPVSRVPNPFTANLVRARRLHFEDWLAVLAFNHLFAGAEAFVSANLWDLPAQVSARRSDRGPSVAVTVPWPR